LSVLKEEEEGNTTNIDSEEKAFRNVDTAIHTQLIERTSREVEAALEGQLKEGLYNSKYLYLVIFILKN
jgi:hypothetical protein